jgi:hypothetical protein
MHDAPAQCTVPWETCRAISNVKFGWLICSLFESKLFTFVYIMNGSYSTNSTLYILSFDTHYAYSNIKVVVVVLPPFYALIKKLLHTTRIMDYLVMYCKFRG